MGLLRALIFHPDTKFGAKMLIDAQITLKIEIQDGGRPWGISVEHKGL